MKTPQGSQVFSEKHRPLGYEGKTVRIPYKRSRLRPRKSWNEGRCGCLVLYRFTPCSRTKNGQFALHLWVSVFGSQVDSLPIGRARSVGAELEPTTYRIMSQDTDSENKENPALPSAESGKVLQTPQPPRNQETGVPGSDKPQRGGGG